MLCGLRHHCEGNDKATRYNCHSLLKDMSYAMHVTQTSIIMTLMLNLLILYVASTDYIGKSEDLLHLPGELVKTFMIELKDDNCVESEEQFFIDVSLSGDAVDKGVQLSSQSYPVKICDNDGRFPSYIISAIILITHVLPLPPVYLKMIMLCLPLMQTMILGLINNLTQFLLLLTHVN